ncbi:MAG: ectoine hydroxylase [Acidobacteria bacterium]|nr:ectoine hydroxylase [Acidobacteriota bacterium]
MSSPTAVADPYVSREAAQPELRPRVDPVLHQGGPAPERLSADDLRSFDEHGYLFVENLLRPDEVRELNQELHALAHNPHVRGLEETITEPGGDIVRSIFRIHGLSRLFEWLARDVRVLDVARQILGSEVYLHQSRANLKPGFKGKEFYWHSDFETWHVEDGMPRMRALSVSIALTENYPFNGPLMLIPGSHKTFVACVGETPEEHYKHSLKKQEYGVPDDQSLKRLADRGGIVAPTGPAGSAVFFDCNTMHGSNSNISPYPRTNAFFVYNSVDNTLEAPFCGLKPRPEHIAARSSFAPLEPLDRG